MDANTESAIVNYVNKFGEETYWDSVADLFDAKTLYNLLNIICPKSWVNHDFDINMFDENSIIEGFKQILKIINEYYKYELKLSISNSDLDIDLYDLVHDK